MNTSLRGDDVDFVARQLAHVTRSGVVDLQTARAQLQPLLTDAQAVALEELVGVLDAPAARKWSRTAPYARLVELYRQEGGGTERLGDLLAAFQDQLRTTRDTLNASWSGFRALIAYFGVTLLVLAVVTATYQVLVLPQLALLFSGLRAELPALTQTALGRGGSIALLLLVVTVLIWVALWWSARSLVTRASELAPISPSIERLPLLGELVREYNRTLALAYARALIAAGTDPGQAWNRAVLLVDLRADIHASNIEAQRSAALLDAAAARFATAGRLGTLAAEIELESGRQQLRVADVLLATRSRAAFVMRLVLFAAVSTLLIAMYLPIFRLGTVI
jgi:type IV pilus assembly protein PilC